MADETSTNLVEREDYLAFDITASVLPKINVPSTISFKHEARDENATFSMQPEKLEHNLLNSPFLFGQWKPKFDCDCVMRVDQRIQEFEKILQKAADAIEKIERQNLAESHQMSEAESIANTLMKIESNLELELQKSFQNSCSEISAFSQLIIDNVKSMMNVAAQDEKGLSHVCQCGLKIAARTMNIEKMIEEEDDSDGIKLPVTLMMRKLFFGKHAREQLNQMKEKLSSDAKDDESEAKIYFEKVPDNLVIVEAEIAQSLNKIEGSSDIHLKNTFIQQTINKYESLSAKASRENAKIMPYSSLSIMNLVIDPQGVGIKKAIPDIESTLVMQPRDIEEVPSKIASSSNASIKKGILKSKSTEDAELNKLYKKVLLLGEDMYVSKSEAIMQELNDDDGFSTLVIEFFTIYFN